MDKSTSPTIRRPCSRSGRDRRDSQREVDVKPSHTLTSVLDDSDWRTQHDEFLDLHPSTSSNAAGLREVVRKRASDRSESPQRPHLDEAFTSRHRNEGNVRPGLPPSRLPDHSEYSSVSAYGDMKEQRVGTASAVTDEDKTPVQTGLTDSSHRRFSTDTRQHSVDRPGTSKETTEETAPQRTRRRRSVSKSNSPRREFYHPTIDGMFSEMMSHMHSDCADITPSRSNSEEKRGKRSEGAGRQKGRHKKDGYLHFLRRDHDENDATTSKTSFNEESDDSGLGFPPQWMAECPRCVTRESSEAGCSSPGEPGVKQERDPQDSSDKDLNCNTTSDADPLLRPTITFNDHRHNTEERPVRSTFNECLWKHSRFSDENTNSVPAHGWSDNETSEASTASVGDAHPPIFCLNVARPSNVPHSGKRLHKRNWSMHSRSSRPSPGSDEPGEESVVSDRFTSQPTDGMRQYVADDDTNKVEGDDFVQDPNSKHVAGISGFQEARMDQPCRSSNVSGKMVRQNHVMNGRNAFDTGSSSGLTEMNVNEAGMASGITQQENMGNHPRIPEQNRVHAADMHGMGNDHVGPVVQTPNQNIVHTTTEGSNSPSDSNSRTSRRSPSYSRKKPLSEGSEKGSSSSHSPCSVLETLECYGENGFTNASLDMSNSCEPYMKAEAGVIQLHTHPAMMSIHPNRDLVPSPIHPCLHGKSKVDNLVSEMFERSSGHGSFLNANLCFENRNINSREDDFLERHGIPIAAVSGHLRGAPIPQRAVGNNSNQHSRMIGDPFVKAGDHLQWVDCPRPRPLNHHQTGQIDRVSEVRFSDKYNFLDRSRRLSWRCHYILKRSNKTLDRSRAMIKQAEVQIKEAAEVLSGLTRVHPQSQSNS